MTSLFAALVASALLVVGCTPSTRSAATTTPSAGPQTAPKVAQPLDPGDYWTKPCGLLTSAQVSALGLTNAPAEAMAVADGQFCDWRSRDTGDGVGVLANTAYTHGLNDIYAKSAENKAYFIPATVSGFPAVGWAQNDERGRGVCSIHVGVNDRQVFDVNFAASQSRETPAKQRSCALAQQAATAVVANLRTG